MKKVRSFLKWAGNKYYSLDIILDFLPKATRLIEPFAGSASLFINTDYPNNLIAEKNADIIGLYQQLQQEKEDFIDYCQSYFTSDNNNKELYYHFRKQFNESTNRRERAALFLYLNRHGFNGLCRYNHQNQYNVPFGWYHRPYFPQKQMLFFLKKSETAQFIHSDFRDVFKQASMGDVIYCDPPYTPILQKTNFTSYTQHGFNALDHKELASLAKDCAAKGITVLISNHNTDETRELYQDADVKTLYARRTISCKALERNPAQELLAIYR